MKKTIETVKHSGRHRFLNVILRFIAGVALYFIMGYKCKKEKLPEGPCIVIANHNTNLDPALVVIGLGHVYFVASEHAFRKGFRSKLMKFVFDPIPISKAQTDTSTLKEIFRRIKAGFNVCVFSEANRSFNGVTGPVSIAAAKMVKISGAALVTYRLEGGYFTAPRWGKKMRKGKMTGRVTGKYSAKEIKSMKTEQVWDIIKKGIHEDAYQRQKEKPVRYKGENIAEDIETVLYLCPLCKQIGTINSEGDRFYCDCGLDATYTETGFLESRDTNDKHGNKFPLPFATITEWDFWQTQQLAEMVKNADGPPFPHSAICGDDNQQLYTVNPASGDTLIGEGPMNISRGEFHCAGHVFPIREITKLTIVGQMTIQFALKSGAQFEIRSNFPRNAVKYREIFNILSNE